MAAFSAAAVAARLLARIPKGFEAPVVVLEVLLGIVLGPHVIPARNSAGFDPLPHLAGIVTTGAACADVPSVSENISIRNVRACFDCWSRSSIQNHRSR